MPLHGAAISREPTRAQPAKSGRATRSTFFTSTIRKHNSAKSRARNFCGGFARHLSFSRARSRTARSARTDWRHGMHFARNESEGLSFARRNGLGGARTWPATAHHFRFVQLPFNLAMPRSAYARESERERTNRARWCRPRVRSELRSFPAPRYCKGKLDQQSSAVCSRRRWD